jgi:hypothetical protein
MPSLLRYRNSETATSNLLAWSGLKPGEQKPVAQTSRHWDMNLPFDNSYRERAEDIAARI